MAKKEIIVEVKDCLHEFLTIDEINERFEADDICEKCKHLKFKNGIMSCDYSGV